jgi:hypothetical protein
MSKKTEEEEVVRVAADFSDLRQVKGILALMFGAGFLAIAIVGVIRATTIADVQAILKEVATLVAVIVAFFFGTKKVAEGT